MKRILKYLSRTLLILLFVLLLIPVLLYIPGVQRYIKNKAVEYVQTHMGLTAGIEKFSLKFPLDLTLEKVFAGKTAEDTLVYVGKLHLDAGLARILFQEVTVRELAVSDIRFYLQNDTTNLRLNVDLERLFLKTGPIRLKEKIVNISMLELAGGKVFFQGASTASPKDTVATAPLAWVFKAEQIRFDRVDYSMRLSAMPWLSAGVGTGRIVNGLVNLAEQRVLVDSVRLGNGLCEIQLGGMQTTEKAESIADTASAWTVRAGHLQVEDYNFHLTQGTQKKFELDLSGIGIKVDSVYNRGTVVLADLTHLQLIRTGGGEIRNMTAEVALQENRTEAGNVYIQTPNSVVRLNASSEAAVSEMMKKSPLRVKMDASVGLNDIALFVKGLPREFLNKRVNVEAELSYKEDAVDVKRLVAAMPGHFRVNAAGRMTSMQKLSALSGSVKLDGDFADLTFLNGALKGKVVLPKNMHLKLDALAERGKIMPEMQFCQDSGCLSVSGYYSFPSRAYDIRLKAEDLDAGHFLPGDSLGLLTLDVALAGKDYRFGKADADLKLTLERFGFKGYVYRDVVLAASLKGKHLDGTLKSSDKNLSMDIAFEADSVDRRYEAGLTGVLKNADLNALNLVQDPLRISTDIDVKASMSGDSDYLLNAGLDNITLDNEIRINRLGGLRLRLDSDLKRTEADVASGDFHFTFSGAGGIEELVKKFSTVGARLEKQIGQRNIDMDSIRGFLPVFALKVNGGKENVVARYLKANGVSWKSFTLDAETVRDTSLYVSGKIEKPVAGIVQFDSVTLNIGQEQKELKYVLRAMNPVGMLKSLYDVRIQGSLAEDHLTVGFLQKDSLGQTGVDIGANISLEDSVVAVSLFPSEPVLGYERWKINENDRLLIYNKWRVWSDLVLSYKDKLVSIRSRADEEDKQDILQVEIKGVNLAAVSGSIPFVPEMSGTLNTDILFYSRDSHVIADGDLSVDSLYYQKQRIGDLFLDINYDASDRFSKHLMDFTLRIDEMKRAAAKGTFSTSDSNKDMAVDMDIPSLPLSVINAFLPSDILLLHGEINGALKLRGTFEKPDIDGSIAFRDGKTEVVMLGTTFGMDSSYIPVKDGRVQFRNYRIVAPNKQNLTINGDIILTPFTRMRSELELSARNFQVVDVKSNPTSLVYGKAFADVGITVKGPFNGLDLTGNVSLLNNTVIDYVLRSSGPVIKDRSVDLVRFVSFQDTTLSEQDQLTNRVNSSDFLMKLFIEIGDAVSVNMNLSEDGNNRVSIKGGGNLIYSMNPETGTNLVGKYTLTGGMVRYGIPVVGEKSFSIQTGSYVEWTGDLLNPDLNISASEALRVNVTEDNQSSRLVNFDAIIRIQNNLKQPQITFDLSAPNDQSVQSQLAAFSAEERTKQAMNLLIYGTYSGPGTVSTGSTANNTLNNFVEKELNQWSRKYLKNVGLTFGIDSYNQIGEGGQEVKRTDYSYQFSKQLFNDKVNVKIGGHISSDDDPATSMEQNLVDDIAIEYVVNKKRNLFLKVFRHTNYESVLEGEVTQTGVGVVYRKSFQKVRDLFIRKKKRLERQMGIDPKVKPAESVREEGK